MNLLKMIIIEVPAKITQMMKTRSKFKPVQRMNEQARRIATSAFHDPKPQPFYGFKDGTWQKSNGNEIPTYTTLPTIKIVSWNIDFQASASLARMTRALSYLDEILSCLSSDMPSMILLQEMTSSDLDIVKKAGWVQEKYQITDVSSKNWRALYGTVALVDRRLRIASVFRVLYASDMGRDALFVDIEDMTPTTLRFCNTHLESLTAEPPLRPAQVELAAKYLKDPAVDGALIAGDFNAIQDFDKTLHAKNGLKDAYLENGGEEDHEDGWTWGMQNPPGQRQKFPCTRMDKILYCGKAKVQSLERIGAGIKIENWREGQFVTDHLGLTGNVCSAEDS